MRSIEDFEVFQNHPEWHKHDRNAKRLAAVLLLPSETILDDSRELHGIRDSLIAKIVPALSF
jgi:hypothetical protein